MITPSVLTATTVREGQAHIAAADKVMAKLMAAHPVCKLSRAEPPFHTLAVSIINQQLSQKAADSIERRVQELIPAPFAPQDLAELSPDKLRAAGLSGSKVRYLGGLATAALDGRLEKSVLRRLDDEAVIARLTELSGVGQWTAEMFLMFCLRRPDVLSLGDAGLLRATKRLYGDGDAAQILQRAAQKWRPYRTIGCWHLWRSLDG